MTPAERYQRITGLNPNSERFVNGKHFSTVSKTRHMISSRRVGAVSGAEAKRLLESRRKAQEEWGE